MLWCFKYFLTTAKLGDILNVVSSTFGMGITQFQNKPAIQEPRVFSVASWLSFSKKKGHYLVIWVVLLRMLPYTKITYWHDYYKSSSRSFFCCKLFIGFSFDIFVDFSCSLYVFWGTSVWCQVLQYEYLRLQWRTLRNGLCYTVYTGVFFRRSYSCKHILMSVRWYLAEAPLWRSISSSSLSQKPATLARLCA